MLEKLINPSELLALAEHTGLRVSRLISLKRLLASLDHWPGSRAGTEVLKAVPRLGLSSQGGSFLVSLLPYYVAEPDDPALAPEPVAKVARFARRNYYQELVKRFKRLCLSLREMLNCPKSSMRIFVNSRLPEKLIACGSGLVSYARNNLLYHPESGSYFVVGLLFLPFEIEDLKEEIRLSLANDFCRDCRLCYKACPTQALSQQKPSLCLKALFDKKGLVADELKAKWGLRFYGCDTCQEVCPHNKTVKDGERISRGEIGPWVKLKEVLSKDEITLKASFKKTALAMSWIAGEALLRNALCAAGNSGCRELVPLIKPYRFHQSEILKDAARYALERLKLEG